MCIISLRIKMKRAQSYLRGFILLQGYSQEPYQVFSVAIRENSLLSSSGKGRSHHFEIYPENSVLLNKSALKEYILLEPDHLGIYQSLTNLTYEKYPALTPIALLSYLRAGECGRCPRNSF